jgi:hypothetical protein
MGRTVRGSIAFEYEIFRTCPDWPRGQQSLLYIGCMVIPWDKTAGAWHHSSPPSNAGIKERAGLSYPSSVPSWQFIEWTLNQHSSAVRACASLWSLLCQSGCRLMDELMDKDFILRLPLIKPSSLWKTEIF